MSTGSERLKASARRFVRLVRAKLPEPGPEDPQPLTEWDQRTDDRLRAVEQQLANHPDVVKNFLKGHVEATNFINENPTQAQQVANQSIAQLTGKALSGPVVASAWKDLTFTWDPLSGTLRKEATDAQSVGLLQNPHLKGLVDIALLNEVLKADGKSAVKG